ncbi:MAG: glycosyltransferase 87 family protein [Methanomassiliicoccaceae archaeon]|nr:glycosyltransferase 87 family protein [Methanomassiliicoccaceae archaeon]
MGFFSDEIKRTQLVISVIFAVGCVIFFTVVTFFDMDSELMSFRFENANDVFNGIVPALEFPPLALVFFLIPRLFAADPTGYGAGFIVMIAVFFMIGLLLVSKIAEKLGKNQKLYMLVYTMLMVIMFEFVADRYDIIPVVFTLFALYCYVTKRYALAFIMLALGTMVKLYPAVLFPIFLIPLLMDGNKREALKGTAAFAAICAVVILPVVLLQPDLLTYFIDYHSQRPMQIESVAASLLYPFIMMGLVDRNFEYSFGSDNIIGPVPDAVASWLTPLMGVCVLFVYVIYAYVLRGTKGKGDESDRLYLLAGFSLISVMTFIIVGKVMSTQYLLWTIPFLLMLMMFTPDRVNKRTTYILFIACVIAAQVQFAILSGYVGGGTALSEPSNALVVNIGLTVIIVKNVLLLLLLYHIARSVRERCLSVLRNPS